MLYIVIICINNISNDLLNLLQCVFSPQCLVKSEACEVEETQILFCYHTAEVITVDRKTENIK